MRTGEAAKYLQVSTSTVRNWLKVFRDYMPSGAELISEGQRYVIGEGDLRVLRYVKSRKDAGLTYEHIEGELAQGLHTIEEIPPPEEDLRGTQPQETRALALPDLMAFARAYAEPLRERLDEVEAERTHYLAELRQSEQDVARLEERLRLLVASKPLPWWRRVFRG